MAFAEIPEAHHWTLASFWIYPLSFVALRQTVVTDGTLVLITLKYQYPAKSLFRIGLSVVESNLPHLYSHNEHFSNRLFSQIGPKS